MFGFRDAESAAADGSPDVRQTAMHICDLSEIRRSGVVDATRGALSVLEKSAVDGFWVHL